MNQKPLLTLGCASFDDHLGVWATFQSLRVQYADVMDRIELILVDNNPSKRKEDHGDMNASLFRNIQASGQACQYIPYGEIVGTSAPRDLIFKKATGDFVFVFDLTFVSNQIPLRHEDQLAA